MADSRHSNLVPPPEGAVPLKSPTVHSESELLSPAPRSSDGHFFSGNSLQIDGMAQDISTDTSRGKVIEGKPSYHGPNLNQHKFQLKLFKPPQHRV
jgi:hypothetical protein